MANSDRKINRGVRVGDKKPKTYLPGMEDELDKVLSAKEVERLLGKGYIEGKWSGNAEPVKTEVKTEAPSQEATTTKDESAPSEVVDLSTLKKDELIAEAEKRGVMVDSSLTKAEIIEAIEAKE